MGLLTLHSTFLFDITNLQWSISGNEFVDDVTLSKFLMHQWRLRPTLTKVTLALFPIPLSLQFLIPILSYLKTLKQHSLFVPFEDQRIKKYRMNEACQWSLELCYIHNNPDLWELNIAPQHNIGGKENQAWLFKTCGNNERVWISGYLCLFLQHNAQRGWMCNIE